MALRELTPPLHPEVYALLDRLVAGVEALLGPQLLGFYIHGSLATGDFDPDRSDIDFIVITRGGGELSGETFSALAEMHRSIGASGLRWAENYEGPYIPQEAVRRYDPARSHHPELKIGGAFSIQHLGSAWVIQRHLIREAGIALVGPPPKELIDPVSPQALRLAVQGVLEEWWRPQLSDPWFLRESEYQAFAILTMCRALHTLETGLVASKPVSARWALDRLDERWHPLIEEAMAWRHGVELDLLNEALAFIQYTLQCSAIL